MATLTDWVVTNGQPGETVDDCVSRLVSMAVRTSPAVPPDVTRLLTQLATRGIEARQRVTARVIDAFDHASPQTQAAALDVLGFKFESGKVVPK